VVSLSYGHFISEESFSSKQKAAWFPEPILRLWKKSKPCIFDGNRIMVSL